ncbi:cysteine-rich with EGF-like domain protein 2 [Tribolium castaneum]|uniref:Cysteine-rich with EGF-like domain protein 2 n=1 Tax=Tribolium castaneum TaxID=7070 RepID=D6W7E0_TRICA|nr:PREDICTED: cysteine-rich with EGF-like domain protein 2 [Tribolium castaneum]EFA11210.1 Cysteine-rich with EGF-like domain protein 2 [Tribolium castaneum]|eukprot:XP_971778.1 PREDICTED: cysteine-rich with EGF-like domain protein 2 [Tribolium castaneum]
MRKTLMVLCIILNLTPNIHYVSSSSKEEAAKAKLPPCRACKIFIESFKKGIEKTKKGKFEGGDTAWEEEKLGSYATSEIRLIEIQESVCSDVVEGKDQCYALHEQYDSEIEEWWFHKQGDEPDLFKYFCIKTVEHCCPDLHYGTNCTPCPGYPDNVCSNNGKCKGSGTRKGSGQCSCDPGYTGETCNACAETYYEAYKDEKKLLCSKCHTSCEGPCSKAGPAGCEKCKPGWVMSKEKGCTDINECATAQSPCKLNQFCVNNDGSYKCLDCDRSCAGCTGDGPDMCTQCASGYVLVDNMCTDAEQESRKQHVFLTRYMTYLGLCVATCIIFNKNTILAAIIGIAVAIYISVSEYVLNSPPIPKTDDLAEQLLHSQ